MLPWKGRIFERVPINVTVNWKPGITDVEISNQFVAERLQIREVFADMVMLRQNAFGIKGIILEPDNKDFDWYFGSFDPNSRDLYLKREGRDWITVPTNIGSFPQRIVADIDREKTERYLPKGGTVDEAIEAFMRIRRIIESAIPFTT